jgi:hypothetical protein
MGESHFQSLYKNLSEYIETRINIAKLTIVQKTAEVIAGFTSSVIIILPVLVVLQFLSVAAALYIGKVTGDWYKGFLYTGLAYMLLALILYIFRNSLIKKPVADSFIKKCLADDDAHQQP